MRDASRLESNSVNGYISSISVDTGMRFYDQRDAAPTPEEVTEE